MSASWTTSTISVASGGVAPGDHQSPVGQVLNQRPPFLADLGARGHLTRVLGALAGLDQLLKDPARPLTLLLCQVLVDLLCVARQGALHTPDLVIGGVGHPAGVQPLPEEGEGELEQGQVARLLAHVVQQPLHQTRLECRALLLGGLDDGCPQLVAGHGSHHQRSLLEKVCKGAVGQRLPHKVGAHRHQQGKGGGPQLARFLDRRQQRVEEATARLRLRAEGVELFELVHQEQHAAVSPALDSARATTSTRGHPGLTQRAGQLAALDETVRLAETWLQEGEQGRRQGVKGLPAGAHIGDEPVPFRAQPGQQAGVHGRRLAGAGRADDHRHRRLRVHHLDQARRERLAAVEKGRVRLAKGGQPAVGAGPDHAAALRAFLNSGWCHQRPVTDPGDQRPRLLLCFDAQFVRQDAAAGVILGDGRAALPGKRQEAHQGAMRALAQGVHDHRPPRHVHALLERTALLVRGCQVFQRLDRQAVQVLPLQGDPFLEGGSVGQGITLQKGALVQGRGTLQACQAGVAECLPHVVVAPAGNDQVSERRYVQVGVPAGVELDGVMGDHQVGRCRLIVIHEPPQVGERLAEVMARCALGPFRPEHAGQAFATVGAIRLYSQVGQQGTHPVRVKADEGFTVQGGLERSKEGQGEVGHRIFLLLSGEQRTRQRAGMKRESSRAAPSRGLARLSGTGRTEQGGEGWMPYASYYKTTAVTSARIHQSSCRRLSPSFLPL